MYGTPCPNDHAKFRDAEKNFVRVQTQPKTSDRVRVSRYHSAQLLLSEKHEFALIDHLQVVGIYHFFESPEFPAFLGYVI